MAIRFSKAERRNPLNAEEMQLARTLYAAISRTNARITIAELVAVLEKLQPDTLNDLLNRISLIQEQGVISSTILNSIDIGGKNAIEQLQAIAPKLALPAFTPSKVDIGNSDAFQNTPINDAFVEQIDYRATAKRIKNVVGLHPKWADAVVKFEQREYSRLVKQGLKEGAARVKAQSNAATYSDRLRSARATMIARTEISIAQNEGRYQSWNQAFDQGFIDPASLKMWMTAKDERTCDICGPMDGEVVPWNGLFSTGDKVAGRVHPHCRCSMVMLPPDGKGQSFKQDYDLLNEVIGWDE